MCGLPFDRPPGAARGPGPKLSGPLLAGVGAAVAGVAVLLFFVFRGGGDDKAAANTTPGPFTTAAASPRPGTATAVRSPSPATPTATRTSAPPATPTVVPTATATPSPTPGAAQASIAAAWPQLGLSNAPYAGDCSTAKAGQVCSKAFGSVGEYDAYLLGFANSGDIFGTLLLTRSGKAVAFDPVAAFAPGDYTTGGTNACLNVYSDTVRRDSVVICLRDGSALRVTGAATFRDGFIWVPTDRGGFVAARWLCGAGPTTCTSVPTTTWVFPQ